MKRASLTLIVLFAIVLAAPATATGNEITFEGGGWGHGVGMSQFGARAMAQSGSTGEQIIQSFYTGVSIGAVGQGNVANPDPLRIGVAPSIFNIGFAAVGGDVTLCLDGECRVAKPGETWRLRNAGGQCRFERHEGGTWTLRIGPGPCEGEMTWSNQPTVRVSFPAINRTYARGKVVFTRVPNNASRYHLLVEIGLEDYMYGLAEMPSSWHMEALRAQAIAGRTYASSRAWFYRNLQSNSARMNQCACHLLATTGDQVYTGWAKEAEASGNTHWGARWVQAVDSTKGKVAIHSWHSNRAVEAFYFSSSGGRTENSEDIWSHRPYLRSVPDPGATTWTSSQQKSFTKAQLATLLGFSTVANASITETFQSGSPKSVVFRGTNSSGAAITRTFTGTQLRQILGLRSHYITRIVGFEPEQFEEYLVGDFTGDGTDEIAAFGEGEWWVFSYSGGALTGDRWAKASPGGWRNMVAGDFTGNGRTDIAMFSNSGTWWVGTSSGSGFSFSRWAQFSPASGWTVQLVGDFTGNGRHDIANYYPGNGTWWVSRSTGSRFSTSRWATFNTRTGWSAHLVGDFTGNGRDDIANYFPGNGTWWVSQSTGSRFSTSRWATFATRSGWSPQVVGDFNGDGRDDIANYYPGNGTWWVSRSTGSSFNTTLRTTNSPASGWIGGWVADLNGDGKDDLVQRRTTGVWRLSVS